MRVLKKFQSGEAAQYITRRSALRKLQLSLNDFRRLCIIKGIYPREPKNRRRAQKGSSDVRILYHAKDIRFLLHETIVWTLREYKIFAKKTGRDRALQDFRNLKRRLSLFPELRIDHIVKERYPTFIDAIKDIDDCLTLIILFSTFPSLHLIPREQSLLCHRLSLEFLHYVIGTRALRNVFISIKGYYFQANIKGQEVTWVMPHPYPFKPHSKAEVDFKLMSIFVEFYTVMLGFVNYRLYQSEGYPYPPNSLIGCYTDTYKEEISYEAIRIARLNSDLFQFDDELEKANEIIDDLHVDDKSNSVKKIRNEEEVRRLRTIFKGLKFFLNREVPREPLVILIRSFGGKVSWDSSVFVGATYEESDQTITHQIADKPVRSNQYLSRDYIQPQWVFDSVNQRCLLPTYKYLVGVTLPPHLSPFVNCKQNRYIPPEERSKAADLFPTANGTLNSGMNEVKLNEAYNLEKTYLEESGQINILKNQSKVHDICKYLEGDQKAQIPSMSVKSGKLYEKNRNTIMRNNLDELRLKARMVKSRHRSLFRSLIRKKQVKQKEKWLLKKKRRTIDAQHSSY